MATTITAGNATNGAAISSDGTGTLDIKTGTGAGTLALNINASQTVTMPGNLVVAGTATVGGVPVGGNYILNSYTSPATWDATTKIAAGLKAVKVTVVGAGGAGGNSGARSPSAGAAAGGGGGGGGSAVCYLNAPAIPGPITITAGAGTNSFGPLVSATAGASGVAGGPGGVGAGGAGGTGTVPAPALPNSFTISGRNGLAGNSLAPLFGGTAGNSALFAGQIMVPTVNPGTAGFNYGGGGGGGGGSPTGPATTFTGGAAAPGIVIVEEFY